MTLGKGITKNLTAPRQSIDKAQLAGAAAAKRTVSPAPVLSTAEYKVGAWRMV